MRSSDKNLSARDEISEHGFWSPSGRAWTLGSGEIAMGSGRSCCACCACCACRATPARRVQVVGLHLGLASTEHEAWLRSCRLAPATGVAAVRACTLAASLEPSPGAGCKKTEEAGTPSGLITDGITAWLVLVAGPLSAKPQPAVHVVGCNRRAALRGGVCCSLLLPWCSAFVDMRFEQGCVALHASRLALSFPGLAVVVCELCCLRSAPPPPCHGMMMVHHHQFTGVIYLEGLLLATTRKWKGLQLYLTSGRRSALSAAGHETTARA